ncbi:MAG: hypothetical protein LBF72_00215 [Holosporales bacterium]|nr:hypothetical protein [Holosporales bacterium]
MSSFSVPMVLPPPGDDSTLITMRYLEAITRNSIGCECFFNRLAPFFAFDAAIRSYNHAVREFNDKYNGIMWKTEESTIEEDEGYVKVQFFDNVLYRDRDWGEIMQQLSNVATIQPGQSYQEVLDRCYEFIYYTFSYDARIAEFFPYDDLAVYSNYERTIDSANCVFPDSLLPQREACKTAIEAIREKAANAAALCPNETYMHLLWEAVVAETRHDGEKIFKPAPGFESIADRISDLRNAIGTVIELIAHVYKAV